MKFKLGRRANVYNNTTLAGVLEKAQGGLFVFRYNDAYFNDDKCGPISLSLPKAKQTYTSSVLFPFFYGLLAEGINKETQCRLLGINDRDHFSRLLATACFDTIGSISVKEIDQ